MKKEEITVKGRQGGGGRGGSKPTGPGQREEWARGMRWESVIDRWKRMRVNEGKRGGSERQKETEK